MSSTPTQLAALSCFLLLTASACSDDEPASTAPERSEDPAAAEGASADEAASTSPAATTDPDSTVYEVLAEGSLQVCTTGDYRPYTYVDPDTGEWSGIDVTMAEDLADTLDVKLELVQTTWSDLLTDLESSCDVAMGGISFNTDRAAEVFFSTATVQDGKAAIARCEDMDRFATIEDINQAGTTVITPIGGTNEPFADENFPDAEVVKWDDNNTIFNEIIEGRADVMVTDASETKWVAHTHEELCAVNPDNPFTFFENGYLLPQGDVVWQQYVNVWLQAATHDGTYAAAEEPWFG